jgi:hypothetical protein
MSILRGWNERIGWAFRAFFEWQFRKRSAAILLMTTGGAVIVAAVGGLAFRAKWGEAELEFGGASSLALSITGIVLGGVIFALGLFLHLQDRLDERRAKERRRILVVEQRGLQRRFSTALKDALPTSMNGQIVEHVIDVTPYFRDGTLADPAVAFAHVRDARSILRQGLGDTSPADVTVVYGGVSPVPLTFLAGTFLEDESHVAIMDWDRTAGSWRELSEEDDGDRFNNLDLSTLPEGVEEVSLSISVSYEVDEAGVRRLDPDRPLLSLRLEKVSVGNHWSEDKQRAMADAFIQVLAFLAGRGVREVHLFLAAPNSVVFRFGRHLDRNMPIVSVYQRESFDPLSFPWSVRMPYSANPEPSYCPTQIPEAAGLS